MLWLEELRLLPSGTWDRLRRSRLQSEGSPRLIWVWVRLRTMIGNFPIRYQLLAVQAYEEEKTHRGRVGAIFASRSRDRETDRV